VPISSRTFFKNDGDSLYNPFGGRFNIRLDYYYVGGSVLTLLLISLCVGRPSGAYRAIAEPAILLQSEWEIIGGERAWSHTKTRMREH
jgi:hypothetical protein